MPTLDPLLQPTRFEWGCATSSFQIEGASTVVHPMMTEACIDYESRIIKEIFPPSGPVIVAANFVAPAK